MASENNIDWRPTVSLGVLKQRAQLVARVREFFARRAVLEVETPILSRAGTVDPNLHSLAAYSAAPGDDRLRGYLHTSPEFAMKRLLAAGSGSIYQICKVFRGGEAGRLHNPEFTMLEWYRVGCDYRALMNEVAALVTDVLEGWRELAPAEESSYRDAFLRYTGLDPHTATAAEFSACAAKRNIDVAGVNDNVDEWRDLLLTHLVEPNLGRDRLAFLYDYPASQPALARIRPGDPPVAERFELYLEGIELANGFAELADAAEQRRRFDADRQTRSHRRQPAIPQDEHLLAALEHGLPDASGVALGIDRLVMLAAGVESISEVLAFPFERA